MNKLIEFRRKIELSKNIENKDILKVVTWLKKRNKKSRMKAQKININNLKDWFVHKNGNISHKSSQFFSIEGVKVSSAFEREIKSWDQPILNQKHGGILAILTRERKNGIIEFLLFARREPGDKNLKLCPSFSATQSNINRAHGGKKTPLSEIVLRKSKKMLLVLQYIMKKVQDFGKNQTKMF